MILKKKRYLSIQHITRKIEGDNLKFISEYYQWGYKNIYYLFFFLLAKVVKKIELMNLIVWSKHGSMLCRRQLNMSLVLCSSSWTRTIKQDPYLYNDFEFFKFGGIFIVQFNLLFLCVGAYLFDTFLVEIFNT